MPRTTQAGIATNGGTQVVFSGNRRRVAEAVGFEPTEPFGSLVFKTSAIDHSATLPRRNSGTEPGRRLRPCPGAPAEPSDSPARAILKACPNAAPLRAWPLRAIAPDVAQSRLKAFLARGERLHSRQSAK